MSRLESIVHAVAGPDRLVMGFYDRIKERLSYGQLFGSMLAAVIPAAAGVFTAGVAYDSHLAASAAIGAHVFFDYGYLVVPEKHAIALRLFEGYNKLVRFPMQAGAGFFGVKAVNDVLDATRLGQPFHIGPSALAVGLLSAAAGMYLKAISYPSPRREAEAAQAIEVAPSSDEEPLDGRQTELIPSVDRFLREISGDKKGVND
ncbi:hypothetical protein HYU18_02630 [Candidatus Woesearchaeota archaeon]|nr:hypothetical protein [Candidatus Woesearchaeota archaeon]